MNLFNRYKKCFGVTLWRWNRTQVELWICPPNHSVGKHYHTDIDGRLMFLCGNVNLCGVCEGLLKKKSAKFKWHNVPAMMVHWFEPLDSKWIPTVFINVEKWHSNPTSAAINFTKI